MSQTVIPLEDDLVDELESNWGDSDSNPNSDSEYNFEDDSDSEGGCGYEEEKQVNRKLRAEAYSLYCAISDAEKALYLQNAAIQDPTQTLLHEANVRDKGKCVQKKGIHLYSALNEMFLVCYEIQYNNSPDSIRSAIKKEIEAARILREVNRGFIEEYTEYLGMFVVCDAWDEHFNNEEHTV